MWTVAGVTLESRLFLGTAQYPSPEVMVQAIQAAGVAVVTVAIRRQDPAQHGGAAFWGMLKTLGLHLLPNTAGCRTAAEAVTMAHMARELFETPWIKLEVIGDDYTLQPDPLALVEAARLLTADGFVVFPYTTEDLVVAQRLADVGCAAIMPWAAPIGSGQGVRNPKALETLRHRLPDIPLIVDAGLGKPSDATQVMEMGFDGVLLNTAVAGAVDPVGMARAFALAVEAGYVGYQAGLMAPREFAVPSTPTLGTPFWHQTPAG